MKTLISSGVSLYLFADTEVVTITDEHVAVGVPEKYVIGDLNSSNAELVLGITAPDDWVGGKYTLSNAEWSLNPSWRSPGPTKAQQEAKRKAAYTAEADPLFFMSQRDEATAEEWQAKVAEIKARYPYPTEEI